MRLALAGAALAVLAAAAPDPARALAADVDVREGAVAVRLRDEGGRPLAGARFEVRSPGGAGVPFAEGRTDRHGWLAFTPDGAGSWTVRIEDASGHARTVDVEVPPPAGAAAPPGPAAATGPRAAGPKPGRASARTDAPAPEDAVRALRMLAAAAGVGAVVVALVALVRALRGSR